MSDNLPGSRHSPPLETDPRARKCRCGRLMYPDEVCCVRPEEKPLRRRKRVKAKPVKKELRDVYRTGHIGADWREGGPPPAPVRQYARTRMWCPDCRSMQFVEGTWGGVLEVHPDREKGQQRCDGSQLPGRARPKCKETV